jgi:DNA-binding IclR family transcriptional regulator
MAAAALESNKAKIAKRVIEVLEFFGARNQPATVMDIARRYGRPQSSTSELLSSLVEMGLLYKDTASRSFTPTPRLATLGVAGQPEIIRDGRLFNYMDRLAQTTRETVALFGLVGTHVQVFRWIAGARPLTDDVGCGSSEVLCASAAGLLLLSTQAAEQARGMLWRLNAEAPAEGKFDHAEMVERVARFRRLGFAVGDAGFVSGAQVSAVLLPRSVGERPLALGVLYPQAASLDAEALVETLKHGLGQVYAAPEGEALTTSSPFVRAV